MSHFYRAVATQAKCPIFATLVLIKANRLETPFMTAVLWQIFIV